MRQMVLAYVFVQQWTVDPNVYSFLYQPHEVLMAHGPNYTIIPRNLPKEEYTAAIEQACHKLKEGEADELRV